MLSVLWVSLPSRKLGRELKVFRDIRDRSFPDNHIHKTGNCASSSQNKAQLFIPWSLLRIVSLLFFLTRHPINLNSTISVSVRITSMSKSCWIGLCVWSVIFILGAWEQSPEFARSDAGVKCWGKSIQGALWKADKEVSEREGGWMDWMIK